VGSPDPSEKANGGESGGTATTSVPSSWMVAMGLFSPNVRSTSLLEGTQAPPSNRRAVKAAVVFLVGTAVRLRDDVCS
jgi:hypothetical protein